MKLRPLYDQVVIQRLPEEETKKNGLYIPDVAKEKPQQGVVVAVGRGKFQNGVRIEPDVLPGDKVLYGKYSGNELKIEDEVYLVMREDEILAVMETNHDGDLAS